MLCFLGLVPAGQERVLVGTGHAVPCAWLLALSPADQAGRAYAVYGGVYIVSSLLWLWGVEGHRPDQWDVVGAVICLVGAGIILWAPRSI